MRIGVLGTGIVGKTLGSKLISLGHEVFMGSRISDNPAAVSWAMEHGPRAYAGAFGEVAAFGELLINATLGSGSLAALEQAGKDRLRGKILLDVSNPLDYSHGFPPTLLVANTDSLSEQIQRAFPDTKVVKALNTMNNAVQADPGLLPGRHTVFLCGDDAGAKTVVSGILRSFGWPEEDILDLGDLTAARGMEMSLALWVRVLKAIGTPVFNYHVARVS